MLFRIIRLISLFCFPVILIGCGALFSVQEWSENYALMDGTQSTTPQAIDGNLNTIGDAVFPDGGGRLRLESEVIITLPEKKKVRRIVVHTDNVTEFDVFVARESQTTERNWTLVKEIKKAKSPVAISILTPYPTDRIRLRVKKTSGDAAMLRRSYANSPVIGGSTIYINPSDRVPGKFREIELYGYKTSEQVIVDKTTDKREQELDDLLNIENRDIE